MLGTTCLLNEDGEKVKARSFAVMIEGRRRLDVSPII
jgi:hypothetical protein